MTNVKWSWLVGPNEERFDHAYDTREEAVEAAKDYAGGAWIVRASKPANIQLSRYFSAEAFLELAESRAFDDYGDPDDYEPIFVVKYEDSDNLKEEVRAVIDAWQARKGLVFTGHLFQETSDLEFIPNDDEEPRMTPRCPKCHLCLEPSTAIVETYTGGTPDFPSDLHVSTLSPGGPGRLIDCLKCPSCGWSVTNGGGDDQD